jgi:glycine cleavage system regulatory protein
MPDFPWHLNCEIDERPGALHDVTVVLAQHQCWLTSFATSIIRQGDQEFFDLDVNLVSDPSQNLAALSADMEALRRRINPTGIPPQRWEFRPVSSPTHVLLPPSGISGRGRFALSVIGVAKPGLVRDVVGALRYSGYNIVASSMAILEQRTAMILLLENADSRVQSDDLFIALQHVKRERQLEVLATDLSRQPPAQQQVDMSNWEHWHFYGLVPEQPGVISSLTATFAAQGASVSTMLARVIGQPAACVVNAEVRVPPGVELETALLELSRVIPWIDTAWENTDLLASPPSMRAY